MRSNYEVNIEVKKEKNSYIFFLLAEYEKIVF